jgi:hypothetical protein
VGRWLLKGKMIIFSDLNKAYFSFNRPDYEAGTRPASSKELRIRSKQTDLSGYYTQIAMWSQFSYSERLKEMRKVLDKFVNERQNKEKNFEMKKKRQEKHLRRHPKR